jgi:hypothetical protein
MILEIIFDSDLNFFILATPFAIYKYKYTSNFILTDKTEFLTYNNNAQSEINLIFVKNYRFLLISNSLSNVLVY